MTITHTPGPWEWDGRFTVTITDADGNSGSFRTQPADARLIAAAPDLLAALRVAQELLDRNGIQRPDIDAALAKAEGR